jgi:signal peptidase II
MAMSPLTGRGLAVAALVVVLDQVTKWWIVNIVMMPPEVIEVVPFFNLVLTWNRGVSFGMFNSGSPLNAWILGVVAVGIAGSLLVWLMRVDRMILALALGLIIGGAVGNLIDRVRFGAVADFLDVHALGYHWPAFNVADSAITIGVVVLIADSLFGSAERRKTNQGLGKEAGK